MDKCTRFSARASLAVVGRWMRQQGVWEMVEEHVHIKQKAIKHKSLDKLLDAFINNLDRARSRGYQHDSKKGWQVLDVNMTGLPAARRAKARSSTI